MTILTAPPTAEPPNLAGTTPLYNLDAVDHFDRNIIDVDKIGIVVHRIPVNEKPDAFAFQSAHRYARGTARSTRGTHGDSGSFCQNVLYIVNRSLYLVHADNGYGHGLLP